jgi:YVTN family beta-propeller protein
MKKLFLFILLSLPYFGFSQTLPDQADGDPLNYSLQKMEQELHIDHRSEGTAVPAGDEVEGDYITQMTFTNDGKYVLVPHRQTNNISVFDFATQEIITNIEVGGSPTSIAVTDDVAVVPCLASNEVYIIDLQDYSVLAVLEAPAQPAKVRVSQDGTLAAVASDEADQAIVIELSDFSVLNTINDFPCFLSKFSLITSGPRSTVYWSDFEITPDNTHLVVGSENGLRFYEIATGNISTTLSDAVDTYFTGLSGDGQKMVAVKTGNPGEAHLINLTDQTLEKTLVYDGFLSTAYSDVAINLDGSRACVPASGGMAALIRFDQDDVMEVNTTSSPNWVGRSPDFQYAISGQFYLTLIDFETGAVVDVSQGRPISNGVVSPINNRLIATDPLRYEAIDFYTFDEVSGFAYLGRQATGSPLEADIPYSAVFTPDADKLVVCNSLSGTVSVIDVGGKQLDAIIPLSSTETYHAAITPDGNYALVPKRLENQVDIISLETMEVVQTINSGGTKPDQIFVLPGGEYAYVVNSGGTDAIGVIRLDGANSFLEDSFFCGNTGISWTNYGIRSGFAATPDGLYGLLATPFDNEVQVIDLQQHEIVASVPLEGFPLQIAISRETDLGYFAGVTLKNDNALAIIAPIGPSAGVLDIYPCGNNPTRISYDKVNNKFAVCLNDDNAINYFDLDALTFDDIETYSAYTPIAIDYRQDISYILLRADEQEDPDYFTFFYGQETLELPSLPIHHFALSDIGEQAAVLLPITDEAFLVDFVFGATAEPVALSVPDLYEASPAPFRDVVTLTQKEAADFSDLEVSCVVYDARGRKLAAFQNLPAAQFELPLAHLATGHYWYQVSGEKGVLSTGMIVKQ